MAWLWVLVATWLVLAALIALLVGRAIREDDPPQKGDPPPGDRPSSLHAPPAR